MNGQCVARKGGERSNSIVSGMCNRKAMSDVMKKILDGCEKNNKPPRPIHEPIAETQNSRKPLLLDGSLGTSASTTTSMSSKSVMTTETKLLMTRNQKASNMGAVVNTLF